MIFHLDILPQDFTFGPFLNQDCWIASLLLSFILKPDVTLESIYFFEKIEVNFEIVWKGIAAV
ncbi:MAG: hypothetical protein C6W54_06260 [Bacillaceae bacterium]|nr:MAG: hypothetical protein C6W54_06260 [Bacillaceae bacterium]